MSFTSDNDQDFINSHFCTKYLDQNMINELSQDDTAYNIDEYDEEYQYEDENSIDRRLNAVYKGKHIRKLFEWMEENPTQIIPHRLRFQNWQRVREPNYYETPLMTHLQNICENTPNIQSIIQENPFYELIPSDYKYDGWQRDRNEYDETPLMQWLNYYPLEFPQQLLYKGWQKDVNYRGETPLMQHLGRFKDGKIPNQYKYKDWKKDTNFRNETPEMIFKRRFPRKELLNDFITPNGFITHEDDIL